MCVSECVGVYTMPAYRCIHLDLTRSNRGFCVWHEAHHNVALGQTPGNCNSFVRRLPLFQPRCHTDNSSLALKRSSQPASHGSNYSQSSRADGREPPSSARFSVWIGLKCLNQTCSRLLLEKYPSLYDRRDLTTAGRTLAPREVLLHDGQYLWSCPRCPG